MQPYGYHVEKTVNPPPHSGKKRKRSDDATNIPSTKPRIMKEKSPDLGPTGPTPSDIPDHSWIDQVDQTIPGPVPGWGLPMDKNKKYEEIVFDKILDFRQKEDQNHKTVRPGSDGAKIDLETGPLKEPEPGPSNVFHYRVKSSTKDGDIVVEPIETWPTDDSSFKPFATELTAPPKISYESDSYQFNASNPSILISKSLQPPSPLPSEPSSEPVSAEHLTVERSNGEKSSPKSRIEEFRQLLSEPSGPTTSERKISTEPIPPPESPQSVIESESVLSSPDYEEVEVIDEVEIIEESDREKSDHEKSDHEKSDHEKSDHEESDHEKSDNEGSDQENSDREETEVTLLDELQDEDFETNAPVDGSATQNIKDLKNSKQSEEDKDFEITEVRTRFRPGLPSDEDVQTQPIIPSAEPRRQSLTWKFPETFADVEKGLDSGSSGASIRQGSPHICASQTEAAYSPSEDLAYDPSETYEVGPSVFSLTTDSASPAQPNVLAESEFSPEQPYDSSSSNSSSTGNSSSPGSSERSESPESPEFEEEPIISSEKKESIENQETTQENMIDPAQSPQSSENSIVSEDQKIPSPSSQFKPVETSPERNSVTEPLEHETAALEIPKLPKNSPIVTEETSLVIQCGNFEVISTTNAPIEPTSILKPVSLDANAVKRSVPDRPPTPGPIRRIPFSEFRSKSRPNSPVIRKHVRTTSMTSSSSEHEELEDENEEDLLKIIQRSSTRIKDVPAKKKIPTVVKPFVPLPEDDSDDSIDLGPVDYDHPL